MFRSDSQDAVIDLQLEKFIRLHFEGCLHDPKLQLAVKNSPDGIARLEFLNREGTGWRKNGRSFGQAAAASASPSLLRYCNEEHPCQEQSKQTQKVKSHRGRL